MNSKKGFTIASFLSLFTFAVGLTIISALLLPISREYKFSVSEAGILFTANFLGFIVFNLVFSLYASKVDKRKILIWCMAAYTLFTYLFTAASAFWVLLLFMTLVGGVGGVIESLTADIIAELNKEHESFYLNFTQVFFGIGALVGPLAAGFLDGKGYNWRTMFDVAALIGLVSTILLIFFKTDKLKQQEELHIKDIGQVFKIKEFNFMIVAMILYVGGEIGVWGWISTLLKQEYKISPLKSSASVALFWGFMIIGRMITAKLTNRMKLRQIILLLSISGTVFTLLIAFTKTEVLVWVLLALIGLSYSGIWATILAYSKRISGKYATSSFYIVVAAGGVGGMIFPYFLGVIGKASSISMTLGMISIIMLGIVVLTLACKTDA